MQIKLCKLHNAKQIIRDKLRKYIKKHQLSQKMAPHALKGQKLLAQGIALGIIAISKAPCKGKSFIYCLVL